MRVKDILKSLLPFDRFVIATTLKPEEVFRRLNSVVEPRAVRWKFWSWDHLPYEGRVTDNSFDINRIIHYRNSALPFIHGKIHPVGKGTEIVVTMHLHILALGFLIMWISPFVYIPFRILSSGQQPDMPWPTLGLVLVGMPSFAYLITIVPYRLEARQSKRFLHELFERIDSTRPQEIDLSSPWPVSRPAYPPNRLTRPGEKLLRRW